MFRVCFSLHHIHMMFKISSIFFCSATQFLLLHLLLYCLIFHAFKSAAISLQFSPYYSSLWRTNSISFTFHLMWFMQRSCFIHFYLLQKATCVCHGGLIHFVHCPLSVVYVLKASFIHLDTPFQGMEQELTHFVVKLVAANYQYFLSSSSVQYFLLAQYRSRLKSSSN